LIQAVGGLKSSAPLQTRVGIATGLVVVGDLIGTGSAQEQAVVGETPNLAARLQGVAEPNRVVIAESTRRLLGNFFDLQDLGAQDLKGVGSFPRAWAVLRSASVESRFEAMHASGLTELVGREEELELLLRRWSKAKNGEGQVVLLSGEAGIGKSRLTAALLEHLAAEPHTRLRYFCSPQHTDSALYPIIGQMERAAGLAHDDTAQVKLDKLDALLAHTSTSTQDAALFADMLSLPNDERYPVLELTPQQRRQKTLEGFVLQVAALARQNAVLMIFEDAHWADPTSLELFGRTVERIRTLRVLLIVTSRPEFQAPWIGWPYVTSLNINRLTERDAGGMIDGIVGNKPLSASIRQDILERTDGIPLFVEEMTKAVLEAESEADVRRTTSAVPLSALAVPASLHSSLMARLDRLGPTAKEVAQIGAAIGREFSCNLLTAVTQRSETDVQSGLERLIVAGLVFQRGAVHTFKHALVQDAAYGTLLRSKRQELHRRIVQVLDERFPEVMATQPELLAHHAVEAGMLNQAVDYWLAAGERALRTSANIEAIKHLSRGLHLLTSSLPETPARNRKELQFQTLLGPAFTTTRGWAAPEAALAYHRADELGQALGDNNERFKIVSGLWLFYTGRGEVHRALEFSDELFRLAEQRNDDDLRLQAHHSAWGSFTFHGDFASSRKHTEQGIAMYDIAKHRSHALTYGGHDPGVCGWAQNGLNLWFLGYPDQAAAPVRRAVQLAEEIMHPPSVAHAVHYGIFYHQFRRDPAAVIPLSDRLAELAADQHLAQHQATAIFARGWVLLNQGQAKGSISELRRALDACMELGMREFEPYFKAVLAEAYLGAGDAPTGLEVVEGAIRFAEEAGVCFWNTELLRLKGALLARLSSRAEVEASYQDALALARHQQARSLELRAAMSLARHWRDQGKRDEAHDLLAPIYGWFTEGFDTLDLKEAKTLLDELSA
jgi:predicted ATPase